MGLRKSYEELEITNGPLDLHDGNINNVGTVSPRKVGDNIHIAGEYPGNNPTERLRSALDAANNYDTIHLENNRYTRNLTIDTSAKLVGEITYRTNGACLYGANWDASGDVKVTIQHIGASNGSTLTMGQYATLELCNFGNATIAGTNVTMGGSRSKVIGCNFMDVTLTSNFTDSLFIANRIQGTLTDNSDSTTLVTDTY